MSRVRIRLSVIYEPAPGEDVGAVAQDLAGELRDRDDVLAGRVVAVEQGRIDTIQP